MFDTVTAQEGQAYKKKQLQTKEMREVSWIIEVYIVTMKAATLASPAHNSHFLRCKNC